MQPAPWAGYEDLWLESEDKIFRVEWVNLGEGWYGDYDDTDPEDVNLLRFDCFVREDGEWRDPGNASYCTRMPADTDPVILKQALKVILGAFSNHYESGYKRTLEQLSWIGPDDFKEQS